jgi:hypothetical protein
MSDLGGMLFDGDAVYNDLPDWKVSLGDTVDRVLLLCCQDFQCTLSDKERLIHAPISDLGGMLFDNLVCLTVMHSTSSCPTGRYVSCNQHHHDESLCCCDVHG